MKTDNKRNRLKIKHKAVPDKLCMMQERVTKAIVRHIRVLFMAD